MSIDYLPLLAHHEAYVTANEKQLQAQDRQRRVTVYYTPILFADLSSLSLIILIISDANVSGSPLQTALGVGLDINAVIAAAFPVDPPS